MASPSTQTITVDRISNGGNAIAQQQHAGKTIHVPAGEVGESYDVRLVDRGGYFEARLVDRTSEIQPRQPGIAPETGDVGKSLIKPGRNRSHSYGVRSSTPGGGLRRSNPKGKARRRRLSRRKK